MIFQFKGYEIVIDDEDCLIFQSMKWRVMVRPNSDLPYLQAYPSFLYFHRLVMGLEKGDKARVDHINGNTLDNRKVNLRLVTSAQNGMNARKREGKTKGGQAVSSRFKGVSFYKRDQKFSAYITYNRQKIHLGYFPDETSAARAYNHAALQYFGEFALLNQV